MTTSKLHLGQQPLFTATPPMQRRRGFRSFEEAVKALANPANFHVHKPRLDRGETVDAAVELAKLSGRPKVEEIVFSLAKPRQVLAAVEICARIPQLAEIAETLKKVLPEYLKTRAESFFKPKKP